MHNYYLIKLVVSLSRKQIFSLDHSKGVSKIMYTGIALQRQHYQVLKPWKQNVPAGHTIGGIEECTLKMEKSILQLILETSAGRDHCMTNFVCSKMLFYNLVLCLLSCKYLLNKSHLSTLICFLLKDKCVC